MIDSYSPRYLFTEAGPQEQHTSEVVAIRNLWNDKALYDYPPLQRDCVWPENFKRALINRILLGGPIHPLLAYREVDAEGVEKYWILDGKQRLTTVYAYLEGKFATSTIAQAKRENATLPVEPGKCIYELTDRSKNLLQSYKFTINIIHETDKGKRGQIFRDVQHQLPLKAAERLASYVSLANDCTLKLLQDSIWSPDFYVGPKVHKETLAGSMALIALELAQNYIPIDSRYLHNLASGKKDHLIPPTLQEAIEARLGVVKHVFDGIKFIHRADVALAYQAVILLEKQGHTFATSDKGRLTSWFGQVLYEAKQGGRGGYAYSIAKLIESADRQRDFWETQLPIVIELCKESNNADLALV